MKEYVMFVTEELTHKVTLKAESKKQAYAIIAEHMYCTEDADEKHELFTKLDVACSTDTGNATIEEVKPT